MNYRLLITRILAFLGGAYFFLQFVLPDKIANYDLMKFHPKISDGFILVGVMTLGLGLFSLVLLHGSKVLSLRKNWFYSLVLLTGLVSMIIITSLYQLNLNRESNTKRKFLILRDFSEVIANDYSQAKELKLSLQARSVLLADAGIRALIEIKSEYPEILNDSHQQAASNKLHNSFENLKRQCQSQDNTICLEQLKTIPLVIPEFVGGFSTALEKYFTNSKTGKIYDLLFFGFFVPLGASIFSLLGFYVVSAAYRAFRIRTIESSVMMISALLVILGQISLGLMLWPGFSEVRMWLLEIPNSAAFRAITIGAEIAGLVLAFRMWFSIEKSDSGSK